MTVTGLTNSPSKSVKDFSIKMRILQRNFHLEWREEGGRRQNQSKRIIIIYKNSSFCVHFFHPLPFKFFNLLHAVGGS